MGHDIVCGQDLSRELYVFSQDYNGESYAFCSMKCRRAFAGEPQRYARGITLATMLGRFVHFLKAEDRETGGGCC